MIGKGDGDIVADTLFGGRLVLHQYRTGHRAGTDAVLLAAAAGIEPGDSFIDVGSGSGAVGLGMSLREQDVRGVLVEADPAAAELACRNVETNGLGKRVSVRRVDLFDVQACRDAGLVGSATLVVTNPPFFRADEVRPSPDAFKASAHVHAARGLDVHAAWLRRAMTFLSPRGRLLVIHRPDAMPELLAAMAGRLGGITLRAVHPRANKPAIRILLGGRLGSRAPLQILPTLVMHDQDGAFTPESEALHEGMPMAFWTKQSRPRRAGLSPERSDFSSRR